MTEILLGCSGWFYKDWIGPFYKAEKASKLKAYSEVFQTVEINSTFYAYPSKGTVMGWLKHTNTTLVISPRKIPFFSCACFQIFFFFQTCFLHLAILPQLPKQLHNVNLV